MEYSINKLAKLAEISTRTLRYYDEIQLLFPERISISMLAQKICALHKEWLGYYWNHYSKESHHGLAQTYVDDPRFRKYYDAVAVGCAEFLRDAINIYCK